VNQPTSAPTDLQHLPEDRFPSRGFGDGTHSILVVLMVLFTTNWTEPIMFEKDRCFFLAPRHLLANNFGVPEKAGRISAASAW